MSYIRPLCVQYRETHTYNTQSTVAIFDITSVSLKIDRISQGVLLRLGEGVGSYYGVLLYVMSYYVILCDVMSYDVILCHIMSYHITYDTPHRVPHPRYVILCHITSYYVILCHTPHRVPHPRTAVSRRSHILGR